MKIKILIIGDIHISFYKDIPHILLRVMMKADFVIHIGDYISKDVSHVIKKLKGLYMGIFPFPELVL